MPVQVVDIIRSMAPGQGGSIRTIHSFINAEAITDNEELKKVLEYLEYKLPAGITCSVEKLSSYSSVAHQRNSPKMPGMGFSEVKTLPCVASWDGTGGKTCFLATATATAKAEMKKIAKAIAKASGETIVDPFS